MNQEILQRYIEGNASQQEKEDVARWLDADAKNMDDFLLLRNIYDTTLWNKKNDSSIFAEERQSNTDNTKKRVKLMREFLKIAAIFVLAFGSFHLFSKFSEKNANFTLQTVYAPEGQRAEVVLSDGTKVWLNAKSSLTFPNEFGKKDRIVELNGEAYFDVTHNEENQFIVRTDAYQVKVHGTEFNVNAYNDSNRFETALIEGSVEVISNSTHERIVLLPNTKVYADNNMLILTDFGAQDQFLWKKGILHFENQYVKDIIEKLEIYYDVKIEVRNKELLNYQYTGKFWTNDGIEHVLKVLQLRHNFKFIKDNMNNITIY